MSQDWEMWSSGLPLGKSVYHRLLVPLFSRALSPQLITLRPVTTTSQFAPHFGFWLTDFLPRTSIVHLSGFSSFLKAHVEYLAA